MGDIPLEQPNAYIKVKSIFCFMIAPEMKRKGIATQLLERVCKDAVQDGFDLVEAYVNKMVLDESKSFRGPFEMYRKNGFTVYHEAVKRIVLRKKL